MIGRLVGRRRTERATPRHNNTCARLSVRGVQVGSSGVTDADKDKTEHRGWDCATGEARVLQGAPQALVRRTSVRGPNTNETAMAIIVRSTLIMRSDW